jgi:hypothetical protein
MIDWKSTAQGLAFVAAPLVVAGAAVAVAHFGKTAASNPRSRKLHTYHINTDMGSQTIEAPSAKAAATRFANRPMTSAQLRNYVKREGGYGYMEEDGVELWRVKA